MKNKKRLFVGVLVFLLAASLLGFLYQQFINKDGLVVSKTANISSPTKEAKEDHEYMLEGYPIDQVPFYKSKLVSSIKYFVNDDPNSYGGYFGKPVNYYNVVYETEASPEEVFAYYRSLMTEVKEEYTSDSQIQGTIGKYKVSASHYGDNPENYAYLQVYLPAEEYQRDNRYYEDYPDIVEIGNDWIEYETSYGLLNQKGGEVEYTQYFLMPKEIDQQIAEYQEKYQNQTGYSYDEKSGAMRWNDNNYQIVLTFSKDHGRIYLMMRRPI